MNISTILLRGLVAVALSCWAGGCRASTTPALSAAETARETATIPEPESPPVEPVAGDAMPDVASLLKGYNGRDFGSPGWRRVSLELLNGLEVTRFFTVVNLFENRSGEVRTLFYLERPTGLKGTSYLLSEQGDGEACVRVHLFLPAGERRVLEVAPDNLDEGLLGSDFTYNDMRTLLPLEGYDYRLAGQTTLGGRPAWAVDAVPSKRAARGATAWTRARFYLAREFSFMLGADYFGRGGEGAEAARPLRRMRVETLEQRGGVWTATRMRMYGGEGRTSLLTLGDARFKMGESGGPPLTPESLPTLTEQLSRRGLTLEESPSP